MNSLQTLAVQFHTQIVALITLLFVPAVQKAAIIFTHLVTCSSVQPCFWKSISYIFTHCIGVTSMEWNHLVKWFTKNTICWIITDQGNCWFVFFLCLPEPKCSMERHTYPSVQKTHHCKFTAMGYISKNKTLELPEVPQSPDAWLS